MFAQGDQWTARNSDNSGDLIGCGIRNLDDGMGGSFSFGFCQATDSDGDAITCTSFNEDLFDTIKANNSYSFITFGWDANDECTRIGFSTQSFYLPGKGHK